MKDAKPFHVDLIGHGAGPFGTEYWASVPKQTMFGFGDGEEVGDCFRCCVAAIMRRDADMVPHFVEESVKTGEHDTILAAKWLWRRGYRLLMCSTDGAWEWELKDKSPLPYIVSGPTTRSKTPSQHHAVVMQYGRLVYDPHPLGDGLLHECRKFLILRDLP